MTRETPQDRRTDWPLEGRRGRYNPRLDELRSERGGGAQVLEGTAAAIFTIPSGKAFHLRTLQMAMSNGASEVFALYSSTTGGTRRTVLINALSPGATRALTDLAGWVTVTSTTRRAHIVASIAPVGVPGAARIAFIRVAGVLRNRLAGETTS